jgi:hypothetical protein
MLGRVGIPHGGLIQTTFCRTNTNLFTIWGLRNYAHVPGALETAERLQRQTVEMVASSYKKWGTTFEFVSRRVLLICCSLDARLLSCVWLAGLLSRWVSVRSMTAITMWSRLSSNASTTLILVAFEITTGPLPTCSTCCTTQTLPYHKHLGPWIPD